MEETIQHNTGPSPYVAPILIYPLKTAGKKRITQAIAEAWNIPEDKVLGSTLVIDKIHPSPRSFKGERVKTPGERHIDYVNARKFYFYVMVELKKYPWKELTAITGRKIALMKYANKMAQIHMEEEKEYMDKAQKVLDLIEKDLVIFPKPTITLLANAKVTDRS